MHGVIGTVPLSPPAASNVIARPQPFPSVEEAVFRAGVRLGLESGIGRARVEADVAQLLPRALPVGLVAFKLILRGHKLCSIIFLHLFHIHIHSRNNMWVLTHFPRDGAGWRSADTFLPQTEDTLHRLTSARNTIRRKEYCPFKLLFLKKLYFYPQRPYFSTREEASPFGLLC